MGTRLFDSGVGTDNKFALGFDAGLGVRYSPLRSFSLSMDSGLTGIFVDPGNSNSNLVFANNTTLGIYAALVGSFYYGK